VGKWSGKIRFVPAPPIETALRFPHATSEREMIGAFATTGSMLSSTELENSRSPFRTKSIGTRGLHWSEDRRADHIAVMLHLRSLYVSKAAILTMLIRSYRSKIEVPLEFQGLGSLGAASVATVFPLRI
jgi:hypothetical protein